MLNQNENFNFERITVILVFIIKILDFRLKNHYKSCSIDQQQN